MIISLVVAASENNAIGNNNQLLWHLPNDMRFFKNTTWGMPVVMGRKTFLSLGEKPLPGRYNIVISRNRDYRIGHDDVHVVDSVESALSKVRALDCKEVFIIGGGQIYQAFSSLANKIYMTRIHTEIEGDTFFASIDETQWDQVYNLDFPADDRHAYAYSFQTWVRK